MTDLPPDPLDELASAHLDGATTPEEEARFVADPELQARVEAMQAVRSAVSAVPTGDSADREATVAAVLARLDQGATVTPLPPVARRPAARTWRVVAVAAAVVAVAALIPFLTKDDSSTQDSASGADTTEKLATDGAETAAPEADRSSAGAPAGSSGGTDGPAPSTTAPAGAGRAYLGDYPTLDALEAAVDAPQEEGAFDSTASAPADASAQAIATCSPGIPAERSARSIGSARVDGQPVLVFFTDGDTRLLVLDSRSCAVVADVNR